MAEKMQNKKKVSKRVLGTGCPKLAIVTSENSLVTTWPQYGRKDDKKKNSHLSVTAGRMKNNQTCRKMTRMIWKRNLPKICFLRKMARSTMMSTNCISSMIRNGMGTWREETQKGLMRIVKMVDAHSLS